MSQLYIVKHPHWEPSYVGLNANVSKPIYWNLSNHRRKFIKRDGIYVTDTNANSPIHYSKLYFWGEYEPYSLAEDLGLNRPRAVHDDLKSVRMFPFTTKYGLNTDPYVFGNRFRYICCQKRKQQLNKGDVVIFGSYYNGNFHFDTVFVVRRDYLPVNLLDTDSQYYQASVLPTAQTKTGMFQMYAEGLMHFDNDKMFSFVPCKALGHEDNDKIGFIEQDKKLAFDMPILNLSALGINPTIEWVSPVEVEDSKLWEMIRKSMSDNNLVYGIHIAEI